jgi:hypothetical protein
VYQSESVAKIATGSVEDGAGCRVGMVLLELLQRVIGDNAVTDLPLGLLHEIENARDLLVG